MTNEAVSTPIARPASPSNLIQSGSWTLVRYQASERQALAVISLKPHASASTKAATQANPWFDATRGGYGHANR